MMKISTQWIGAIAITGLAALLACSGKAANNFGNSGDQCLSQAVSGDCFSCLQNNCSSQLSSFEDACSDFIGCACTGGTYSFSSEQSPNCQSAMSNNSSCVSANGAIGGCTQQSCASACLGGSGSSSGGVSSSSSGSGSGSSSGGVSSSGSGSGSGSSSGGVSSSSSSGSGSGSSSGGVMGTTACDFQWSSTTCASCVSASCCSQGMACGGDPACGQLVTCVGGCAMGDQTCIDNCASTAGSAATNELQGLLNCLQASCASAGC